MMPKAWYIPDMSGFQESAYIVKKIVRTSVRIHQSTVFFFDLSSFLAGFIVWINAREVLSNKPNHEAKEVYGVYK